MLNDNWLVLKYPPTFFVTVWPNKKNIIRHEYKISAPDIDECASDPCGDHGSCTDGVNGYTCGCDPGYTGTNCEIGRNLIFIDLMHIWWQGLTPNTIIILKVAFAFRICKYLIG
jgi:hypothetical protein